jgi:hypothetical protein
MATVGEPIANVGKLFPSVANIFDLHARQSMTLIFPVVPSSALADVEAFGLGWSHFVYSRGLIVQLNVPQNSPTRRELIFRNYAFEVFGLAFDAISNSSVRLDWQPLNHCVNGGLIKGHSPLRPLTQVTNIIS